jgi:hypothetical protein
MDEQQSDRSEESMCVSMDGRGNRRGVETTYIHTFVVFLVLSSVVAFGNSLGKVC